MRAADVAGLGLAGMMLCAGTAQAQTYAAGLGYGTQGLEAHAAVAVTERLALRGTLSDLSYSVSDLKGSNVSYDAKADFSTVGAFLDWRPFDTPLTLTAGGYFGDRKVKLRAAPTGNVTIGGVTYTPAQAGTLDGVFDLGDAAPYLGIAWDTTFAHEGPGFAWRAALGVAFGDPAVTLTSSTGLVAAADLAAEARRIEDDGEALKTYPVLSLSGFYRF